MSGPKLDRERRWEMVLSALSGESKQEIAERHGVSVQAVYQAEKRARKEAPYWRRALKLMR